MPSLTVVTSDHAALMEELEALRQRSVPKAFKKHEGKDPVKLDVLSRIVEKLRPDLLQDVDGRVVATTEVLLSAIEKLPEIPLPRAVGSEEVTWRYAAKFLFQVPPLPFEVLSTIEQKYPKEPPQTSAKIAWYIQDLAGLPFGPKPRKEINNLIRSELAKILLSEVNMAAPLENPESVPETDQADAMESPRLNDETRRSGKKKKRASRHNDATVDFRHSKGVYHGPGGIQINYNF
ncbi:hypothetical protein ACIHAX_28560 [Nocardia sp. NPDC051929]|uniref:hypothetical protein n=1 Tax=Nocardia sp. NPDC051929 TaxID=3364327 RepID=UPI0037C88131